MDTNFPPNITFPIVQSSEGHLWENGTSPAPSTIEFWYALERSFMDVVQPAKLTADFVIESVNILSKPGVGTSDVTSILERKEVVGVLTLVILGLLYAVGMLIGGIVFCCCQCCSSGYQKFQPKGAKGARCSMTFCLFIFCFFISFGTGMLGVAMMDMVKTTDTLPTFVNSSFTSLDRVLSNTQTEFGKVFDDGFRTFKTAVQNDVHRADVMVLNITDTYLKPDVDKLLKDIATLGDGATEKLTIFKTHLESLNNQRTSASGKLVAIRTRLRAACDRVTPQCSDSGIDPGIAGDFPTADIPAPEIGDLLVGLETVNRRLKDIASQGQESYGSIKKQIEEKKQATLTELDKEFATAHTTLDASRKLLDEAIGGLRNNQLRSLHDSVYRASEYTVTYRSYIYYSVIAIITLFAVMAASLLISTLMGATLYKSSVIPTKRTGCIRVNGCCLIVIVYFIVIFAWLFMLLTTILFVVGTQLQSGACPILDGKKNNFKDLQTVFDQLGGFDPSGTINQTDLVSGLLNRCRDGATFYNALGLDSVFNFTELKKQINDSDILETLHAMQLGSDDHPPVIVYPADTATLIDEFKSQLEVVNLDAVTHALSVIRTDFSVGINTLADRVSSLAPIPTSPDEFREIVDSLRSLTNGGGEVAEFERELKHLSGHDLPAVPPEITRSLATASAVEERGTGTQLHVHAFLKNATRDLGDRSSFYLTKYVLFVGISVEEHVGQCRPLYEIYSNTVSLFCRDTLPAINGIWFSLGLILIILCPTAIVGACLAKYYRRANSTDVHSSALDKKRLVYCGEDEF